MITYWIYLAIAIICEVIATCALKASNGFTHFGFSSVSIIGYSLAFYFLAHVLKAIPVGIAYAIWSGVGIALVTLIGYFLFNQKLDVFGYLGIALIIAGVIVINLLSRASEVV